MDYYDEDLPDTDYLFYLIFHHGKLIRDDKSDNLYTFLLFKHKKTGMLDLVIEGKIRETTEKYGSYEWASLPPGRYGQPIKTMEQVLALYEQYLKEELEGKSDLHLKQGFLKEFEESCKCGGKNEQKNEQETDQYNINILFDNANDSNTISVKSINIIKKIAHASNNSSVYITSSVRSPRRQAEIMYEQTVSLGTAAQYNLYGSNGDKIIDVYVANKKEKKTKEEIIQAMENKISEIGAYKVSKHCGNHSELNVFDISKSRLKNPNDFLTEANKYLNSEIKTIINETDRGCYHFEVQQ